MIQIGDTVKARTTIVQSRGIPAVHANQIYCTVLDILEDVAMLLPWNSAHECITYVDNLYLVPDPRIK